MNAVLERILATERVSDGSTSLPLRHPDFPALRVAVDREEGELLQQAVADIQPRVSVEIGCAYGVSTLYICEALATLPHASRHIVIDPFQSTQWRGIGRRHLTDAGLDSFVDFREDFAELALASLLRDEVRIDLAFVDGWHTFDQVMLEFYFLNRLLRVGGVIVFDDADRRSVNRVVRHALTYPSYRLYATTGRPTRVSAAGRVRRALAKLPPVAAIVRPDVLRRDWDLGILASCVAIRKIADDRRTSGWDSDF
ncbi:MAG TPA: class I SAM-dependent methyltransferase [Vicinamibacterales bacterium]|nr:class I SAM-dependent methyltransferase [Vicinamibacterales bacterium]